MAVFLLMKLQDTPQLNKAELRLHLQNVFQVERNVIKLYLKPIVLLHVEPKRSKQRASGVWTSQHGIFSRESERIPEKKVHSS